MPTEKYTDKTQKRQQFLTEHIPCPAGTTKTKSLHICTNEKSPRFGQWIKQVPAALGQLFEWVDVSPPLTDTGRKLLIQQMREYEKEPKQPMATLINRAEREGKQKGNARKEETHKKGRKVQQEIESEGEPKVVPSPPGSSPIIISSDDELESVKVVYDSMKYAPVSNTLLSPQASSSSPVQKTGLSRSGTTADNITPLKRKTAGLTTGPAKRLRLASIYGENGAGTKKVRLIEDSDIIVLSD